MLQESDDERSVFVCVRMSVRVCDGLYGAYNYCGLVRQLSRCQCQSERYMVSLIFDSYSHRVSARIFDTWI